MPGPSSSPDMADVHIAGTENRLQRVENASTHTAIEVAKHGVQLDSVADKIDSLDERLEAHTATSRKRFAHLEETTRRGFDEIKELFQDSMSHPEHGFYARMAKLEDAGKATTATSKRRWGLAAKVLIPVSITFLTGLLALLGIQG